MLFERNALVPEGQRTLTRQSPEVLVARPTRQLVDSGPGGGYFDCMTGSPDRRHLAACYRRHGSIAGVAEELDVAYETARRWLRNAGVPLRGRGRPSPGAGKAPVDQIIERYRKGESVATIASTMDVSPNTVRNRLIDAGEQLRPRTGWKR